MIIKKHILAPRKHMYCRDGQYSLQYENIGLQLSNIGGIFDLDLFIINPYKFDFIPESDTGFLSKITTGVMPNTIVNRSDLLVNTCLDAKRLFSHSLKAKNSMFLNYIDLIKEKNITTNDAWAYSYEEMNDKDYFHGVSNKLINRIEELSNKTKHISKVRNRVFNEYLPINGGKFWRKDH